jgi:protein-S-isoprenylcysteine O-methyltransferase Ste14
MTATQFAARQSSRGQLATMALLRLVGGLVVLPALLILPAGTTAYWEAWVYLAIILVPMTLTAVYLFVKDPELLEQRMKAREQDAAQGRIVALASVCFLAAVLIPGFDRRLGWSHVPAAAVVAADLVVLAGYGLFVLVLRENRSASRVIQVQARQRVVCTGPYAVVRHPMYFGFLAMVLATPVALASWWALIPAMLVVPGLVARIQNEERMLATNLPGYRAYMQATRHRLIPGIW